jgi:hypothetical protein
MGKRFVWYIGSSGLTFALLLSSAWASECPSLIAEANQAMASMQGDQTQLAKAKALVAEAQQLHNTGNHDAAVEKANEALTLATAKQGSKGPSQKGRY